MESASHRHREDFDSRLQMAQRGSIQVAIAFTRQIRMVVSPEDVLQEAACLMLAMKEKNSLPVLETAQDFLRYFKHVVKNVGLKMTEHYTWQKRGGGHVKNAGDFRSFADHHRHVEKNPPEAELQYAEVIQRLLTVAEESARKLAGKWREMALQRRKSVINLLIHGLTTTEIAKVLDIPDRSVRRNIEVVRLQALKRYPEVFT